MKKIKLRRTNNRKYCTNCREIVEVVMEGLDGFCPNLNCGRKIYTTDTRQKVKK